MCRLPTVFSRQRNLASFSVELHFETAGLQWQGHLVGGRALPGPSRPYLDLVLTVYRLNRLTVRAPCRPHQMHSMEMEGFVGFGRHMVGSLNLRKWVMTCKVQVVVRGEDCMLCRDLVEVVAG